MSFYRHLAAASAVPVFTQVRLSDAISATPEDPNSVFNSESEDAAGWDVEIQGISVDSIPEGAWFRFELGAAGPFAAWRGDGTQWLVWRFTEVVAGDNNWWVQGGIHDNDAVPAGPPRGTASGVEYQSGASVRTMVSNSSVSVGISLGAPPLLAGFGLTFPVGPDGAGGVSGHSLAWGKAGTGLYLSSELSVPGTNSGTKRAVLGFGTKSDTTLSAQSAKMMVEVAVVSWLDEGLLP